MEKRIRHRRVDSGDKGGEYVTPEYADANPDTTVAETYWVDSDENEVEVDHASDRGVLEEDATPS